ncbi:nucleotidyltransferase family protein [Pedobacter sp. UBA5917]|jgi:molybdenum cofactor cytidylyltransferase|uniref:nucleotidyltransferase family protein n=1 Tax=Pedobacter sp. UBA5917 TaxID=1947061 RepID=UPI0025CBD41C|nr:nucleotidyltransferase family protein [Pedobacter sp. UBA5917]
MDTAIIILAAGNSSRMGKPKQLLNYKGKTLLQTVINEALKTHNTQIIVVLGSNAEEILAKHQNNQVDFVINKNWESGMASSIVAGLSSLIEKNTKIKNIIIAVADQVFIKMSTFNNLIEKHIKTGKNIIASSYAQTIGTPVFFGKDYFDALLSLKGTEGAKKLLKQYPLDVETVVFEGGEIDIDTATDYNNLISKE